MITDCTIHQRFEDHVLAQPQALAVTGAGGDLTYEQLWQMAKRVTNALLAGGLRGGSTPVLVLAERSTALVAALLGTIAAGGAFVCLSPHTPPERLRRIRADLGGTPAVVTDDSAHAATAGGIVVMLQEVYRQPSDPPMIDVGVDNLAYIAFTSGSTGRPKGIPHTHRTLGQFVAWQGEAFGIGRGTRVAQLAQQSFDVAYCEIFGALSTGASLHIIPDTVRNNPSGLGAWLARERISLLQIVPSHWQAVLASLDCRLPDLRTILFVGEGLSPELVTRTREMLVGAPELVNIYGPTEVVAATFHRVGDVDTTLPTVPIGGEIPGREIVLVSDRCDPTIEGEIGEICIRSPYLTAGYLERPDESHLRFVQNPLERGRPDPVFRTGDLARRLPSGNLLFVGRTDNQIKLLGQRIELEEIEAAITSTGTVIEVAVCPVTRAAGTVIVAHVVPGAGFDPARLRQRLEAELPAYMVPGIIATTDALPRNANGKIDRAQLRNCTVRADDGLRAAPEGDTELAIAEIWREVLGLDEIGRYDNFFAVGGESLLATRLVSQMRSRLRLRITLRHLFNTPTVAGLAEAAASAAPAPLLAPRS